MTAEQRRQSGLGLGRTIVLSVGTESGKFSAQRSSPAQGAQA
jgi:hypothetical protein